MSSRRWIAVAVSFVFFAAAISGCDLLNPATRLYGLWKLDANATIERAAAGSELKRHALRAMFVIAGVDVTMEFRPDGTGEMRGSSLLGTGNGSGTWKLVSAERDALRIAITTDQGTHELVLRMLDANTFEVDLPAGGQVNTATFVRVP